MGLAHPALNTSGKQKGKQKFRNSTQAKKSRELKSSWEELQKKWGISDTPKKQSKSQPVVKLPTQLGVYRRDTGPKFTSLNEGRDSSPALKAPDKVYTGDNVLGITIMHKSCLQPVFNQQEAIDAAKMRR